MGNQKDTFRPRGRSRGVIGAVSGLGILLRAGLPGVPPWRSSARRPPYRSGAVPALHRLPPPRPYVWGRRSRPCGQNASRPEGSCQKGNHRDKTGKTKHPLRLPLGGNVLRASPGGPFSERGPPPWGAFVSGLQKKRKLPPPLSAPPPGIPSRLLHCFCPVLLGFLPSRAAGIPEGQRDRRDGVSLGPAFLKKAIHSKRGQGPCRSRKSVN